MIENKKSGAVKIGERGCGGVESGRVVPSKRGGGAGRDGRIAAHQEGSRDAHDWICVDVI